MYRVHHVTTYRYARPVGFGAHRMMFSPREGYEQQVLESELNIAPRPSSLRWSRDALGNRVGLARFSGRASELRFESVVRVALSASHPDGLGIAEDARTMPVALTAGELLDLGPYITRRAQDGAAADWARSFVGDFGPTPALDCLTAMTHAIRNGFTYVRRTERGIQEPAETLHNRSGTCRDFAVLMIEAVRSLGLPARFVSGYLYVPSRDRQDVRGGGATHAWLQVYLPGAGWVDFDPTNATVGNAGLIRVAVAREPEGAVPLSGSFIGFRSDDLGMHVSVKVTREQAEDEQNGADLAAPMRA
jgi:transglutaminase-like putative cysteine protease